MHFSITIDHATVLSEKALAEFEIIRHIKACFACLGYPEDSFVEMLAHYLELEHGMTVLPEEEYQQALNEAREEAYGEGRADREEENREDREWRKGTREHHEEEEDEEEEEWSSEQWYDAGWKDGYSGGDPDEEMKEDRVYMSGYKNGREALRERERVRAVMEVEEEEGVEPDPYYQGWQDAFNSRVDAQDPIMRKAEYRKGVVDGFNARGDGHQGNEPAADQIYQPGSRRLKGGAVK